MVDRPGVGKNGFIEDGVDKVDDAVIVAAPLGFMSVVETSTMR